LLFEVHFESDGAHGWLAGNGVFQRTDDGGQHWRSVQTDIASAGSEWNIFSFALNGNNSHGLALGSGQGFGGFVLTTDNPLRYWKKNLLPYVLTSVAMANDGKRAWAVGSGAVFHTFDNGRHWFKLGCSFRDAPNAIAVTPDASAAWIVGENGALVSYKNTERKPRIEEFSISEDFTPNLKIGGPITSSNLIARIEVTGRGVATRAEELSRTFLAGNIESVPPWNNGDFDLIQDRKFRVTISDGWNMDTREAGCAEDDTHNLDCRPRRALVIGNSRYSAHRLMNPANDARDVSDELAKLRFENLRPVFDLTEHTLRTEFDHFIDSLRAGDVALVYFSGHGFQIGNDNYLLPTDFDFEDDEREAQRQGYSLRHLISRLKDRGISLGIIILDTCRVNPYAGQRSFVKPFSADPNTDPGFFIAFSTSPGEGADEGEGRGHSPFTEHLVDALRSEPDLPIDDLFSKVGTAVKAELPQTAWTTHTANYNFHFRPQ
jgi:hypothetical protein